MGTFDTAAAGGAPRGVSGGLPTGNALAGGAGEDGGLDDEPPPPPPPPKRSSLARALAFWASAASLAGDMDLAASSTGVRGLAPPLSLPLCLGVSKTLLPVVIPSSSSSGASTSSPYRSLNSFARTERFCTSPLRPPPVSSEARSSGPLPFPGLHSTPGSPVLAFLFAREPTLL